MYKLLLGRRFSFLLGRSSTFFVAVCIFPRARNSPSYSVAYFPCSRSEFSPNSRDGDVSCFYPSCTVSSEAPPLFAPFDVCLALPPHTYHAITLAVTLGGDIEAPVP